VFDCCFSQLDSWWKFPLKYTWGVGGVYCCLVVLRQLVWQLAVIILWHFLVAIGRPNNNNNN
jgi:NADH:ubiquinone oxidoreductase subunit 4 (subunit M)